MMQITTSGMRHEQSDGDQDHACNERVPLRMGRQGLRRPLLHCRKTASPAAPHPQNCIRKSVQIKDHIEWLQEPQYLLN
jgi:hypothetical protein